MKKLALLALVGLVQPLFAGSPPDLHDIEVIRKIIAPQMRKGFRPEAEAPKAAQAGEVQKAEVAASDLEAMEKIILELFMNPHHEGFGKKGKLLHVQARRLARAILEGGAQGGEALGMLLVPFSSPHADVQALKEALQDSAGRHGLSPAWKNRLVQSSTDLLEHVQRMGRDAIGDEMNREENAKAIPAFSNLDSKKPNTEEEKAMRDGMLRALANGIGIDLGDGPLHQLPPVDMAKLPPPPAIEEPKFADQMKAADEELKKLQAERKLNDAAKKIAEDLQRRIMESAEQLQKAMEPFPRFSEEFHMMPELKKFDFEGFKKRHAEFEESIKRLKIQPGAQLEETKVLPNGMRSRIESMPSGMLRKIQQVSPDELRKMIEAEYERRIQSGEFSESLLPAYNK